MFRKFSQMLVVRELRGIKTIMLALVSSSLKWHQQEIRLIRKGHLAT